jgi:hypothetical protein
MFVPNFRAVCCSSLLLGFVTELLNNKQMSRYFGAGSTGQLPS